LASFRLLDLKYDEAPFIVIIYFIMTLKRRRKIRKNSQLNLIKKSNTSLNNLPFQYTVKLTKQAYEEREKSCSYKDYLALITLACFNEHEIKHIQVSLS
jgi:hypothetical protein